MSIRKKFISADAVDQSKILLDSNGALRSKNSEGSAVSLFKLNSSDVLQFLQLPQVAIAPATGNDIVNKTYADSEISLAKAAEQSRAMAAEAAEQSRALAAEAAEQSRALAAEASLESAIAAERSRAMGVEQSLSTAINYITSNVDAAAIDSLVEIVTEFQRADSSLQGALSALSTGEQSRAMAAEASLQNSILVEYSRALAAETSLESALASESSRALAAESSLEQALANEQSRAMAMEDTFLTLDGSRSMAGDLYMSSPQNNGVTNNIKWQWGTSGGWKSLGAINLGVEYAFGLDTGTTKALIKSSSTVTLEANDAMAQNAGRILIDPNPMSTYGMVLSSAGKLKVQGIGNSPSDVVISGVATPVGSSDAVNKGFVDSLETSLQSAIADEQSRAMAAEETFLTLDGSRSMAGNLKMAANLIKFEGGGMYPWSADMGDISIGYDTVSQNSNVNMIGINSGDKDLAIRSAYAARMLVDGAMINKGQILVNSSGIKLATEGTLQVAKWNGDDIILAGIATPTSLSHAVPKGYLDSIETSLVNSIDSEYSRAYAAEQSVAQALADEISRASGVESSLIQSIADEQSRALAQEGSIAQSVQNEYSRALAAETSLQNAISSILSNVDPAALDSLTEIVNAFQNADTSLQGAISSLSSAASSGLANEVSRATAAEASISLALANESSRALAAETSIQSALSTSISNEQSRALAAEASISQSIVDSIAALRKQVSVFEQVVLSAGDVSNQYIELGYEFADLNAKPVIMIDRVMLVPGEDFTISNVSSKGRITFTGAVATGGAEALVENDKLNVWYVKSVAF